MSQQPNRRQSGGSNAGTGAIGPNSTDAGRSGGQTDREILRERLERQRAARQEFDTVTVGNRHNRPPRPQPKITPLEQQRRAREEATNQAPVYSFQIAETFSHDVPGMRSPSAVHTNIKTVVDPESGVRKLVPYQQGPLSTHPLPQLVEGSDGALVAVPPTQPEIVDPDEALMLSIQHATSKKPQQWMTTTGKGGSSLPMDQTVAPNDEAEIANLKNAEDVISYFSTHGATSAVKFVYLNQAPKSMTDFRPYDLNVVLKGQQEPDHFIISASGVVSVKPGQPSEVVSLSDWMKETSLFNVLRRIRMFRTYLVYKAFSQWRKNIRLRLYAMTRRRLCNRFFLSKATFASTTTDLIKTSYELTTTSLFHYEQHKPDYTTEDFQGDQANQRAKAQQEFGNTLERMEGKLTKLAETIQQRANVPDLTTMESLEQYLLANSVATNRDKRSGKKTKSMLEAKEEQYERMRELKRAMVEYAMLDSFIRLVDYVATENLFRNALLTVTNFKELLITQKDLSLPRKVGFQIQIHPSEEAMTYKPSETDLQKAYAEVVDEMIGVVNDANRLELLKPLKIYFPQPPKWWNIRLQFNQDARVMATKHATNEIIRQDFVDAHEKMPLYDKNRQWLTFIRQEWPETQKEWENNKETLTCATITKLYDRLRQAVDSFGSLVNTSMGHLIFLNAGKLKGELEPKIKEIKKSVHVVLKATASARCRALRDFFHETTLQLDQRPTELKKFADFVALVNRVVEGNSKLEEDLEEAESLYLLAEQQASTGTAGDDQLDLDDEDKQLRESTLGGGNAQATEQSLRDKFTITIERAQDYKEEKKAMMIKELIEKITLLNEQCGAMSLVLSEEGFVQPPLETTPQEIVADLNSIEKNLEQLQQEAKNCTRYQELFDMPMQRWTELTQVNNLFEVRKEVWTSLAEFNDKHERWFSTPLEVLEVEDEMEPEIKKIARRCLGIQSKIREEQINDEVAKHLKDGIDEVMRQMPIIRDCGNHNMKSVHWDRILGPLSGAPTGEQSLYSKDLNLNKLHGWNVWEDQWKELIAEQSAMATGEKGLLNSLNEVKEVWDAIEFDCKKYKDDQHILQGVDETIQQLDDHHVKLQTALASPHVHAMRSRVDDWATKLRTVNDVIDEWVTMQKNWMYLEFIFSAEDIKAQLPEESRQFDQADKLFKEIMKLAATQKNVFNICTEPGLLLRLKENNKAIDEIQKRLEDYLETKRVAFPRFYFLSNDELLSILSDVRNPRSVQPHLSKCFDNIHTLIFNNEAATEIGGMRSGEQEEVLFERPVNPIGSVEVWLGLIQATMKSSLHMHMRETIDAFPRRKREEWYMEFPAQCIQAVDMVVWTGEVEAAMGNNDLAGYHENYQKQILRTVDLVKTELTKLQRSLVVTLIVVDVHNRDVVGRLVETKVTKTDDFEWVQQLKYYWETNPATNGPDVSIHHASAHLWYGYEYLGNQPRLVITPLTDRAFLTCTSALAMNLGAAPQGPAGTGKTESVKDLGKALARQVVVFNCSDGINYKTMSRMFAGLAQAGAWACFDEFNRIELEVLSVIAQQMLEICMALERKQDQMEFDGHTISLSKNFGVFITMNPGYAGRTELPDNLKALFRPICMMIPDYALIAEIMFYSEGFSDARQLAQKMVQLYKLSSEQLSKQDHYDFGMRAVKSILVMAGSLKRANPNEDENMLLIRAMRDSNVPKFLREDTVLFMALVKDLFPNVEIDEVENEILKKYICQDLEANKFEIVSGFLTKSLQLADTLDVRHGVMMVGVTMCAKTTIMETLQRSLTAICNDQAMGEDPKPLFNVVETNVLNPKAVSMGELYGEVNNITREWTDGILSNIAREIVKASNHNSFRQWVIFDGPVDAIWIENMNTVLDDNKMLCLFNGERIKLPQTATFMFEVQDLRHASPATVSRCGMVFVEPYYMDGGWKPIAKTQVLKYTDELSAAKFRGPRVVELLDKVIPPTLDFLRSKCKEFVPSVDAQLVVSLITLLYSYVKNHDNSSGDLDGSTANAEEEEDEEVDPLLAEFKRPTLSLRAVPSDYNVLFDMYFTMSYIWSLGANLADNSRDGFNDFALELLNNTFQFPTLSKASSIWDVCIHRPSLSFISWSYTVPDFKYRRELSYFDQFVPTVETTALRSVMTSLTAVSRNVLVVGVTGVGKSVMLQDFLTTTLNGDSPSSSWEYFSTVLSAQTKANDLQDRVEGKLQKIKANLMRPSHGKRSIFFIDDLNMPALEKYGASPPIELLRQLMTQGGFFDKKKQPASMKYIQDLMFVASCGVPGGGRNELTPRLTSQFHMICEPTVTPTSMRRIFTSILGGFLSVWPVDVRRIAAKIVEGTKQCYDRIAAEKLPTPAKVHYTFNLRDFSKVVQGVLQVTPDTAPDRVAMVRLWVHEVSRVFYDRLIDEEDRRWWWQMLQGVCESEFDFEWQPYYENLLFGDYMRRENRVYEEVADMQSFQDKLVEYQMAYNLDHNKETELVFFKDAVHHLSNICRICRQPRGHALLVGVGGSGRQSLTKLAAYISNMPLFQISITRTFTITDFRDNMREMLLEAGCKNQDSVFLIADSQIVHEQMLEDINNILNTGEVPNMMQPEDQDKIIEHVRKYAGKDATRPMILQHFVQLCRSNLHVVLTMSPVGDSFRQRLRMFPSLVNCMTIDWFIRWPAEALNGVAARNLDKIPVEDLTKAAICSMCVTIHEDVQKASTEFFDELRRHNYTTPTSYLELLNCYNKMFEEQGNILTVKLNRYQGGLDKLTATQTLVDHTKERIITMQPVLETASAETETMMKQVEEEQKEADIVEKQCSREKAEASIKQQEADAVRAECEGELEKAMPAYNDAVAALSSLSSRDISEVKGFKTPHEKVKMVLEAVLILLQEKDTSWDRAKQVMGGNDFLRNLREYEKDDISERTIRNLKKYIQNEDFVPDVIAKYSFACKSLCLWVRAIDNYYHVGRTIAPKKESLAAAEAEAASANASVAKAEARLKAVLAQVAGLKKAMQENIDKKKSLEDEMALAEARLGRAGKLMSGLASEHVRWKQTVKKLKKEQEDLVGSMLLAAGCVAYLGPFTAPFRQRMMTTWADRCVDLNIPVATSGMAMSGFTADSGFSLTSVVEPKTIRDWVREGLPEDAFSVENAIITTRSQRWPLCIDPQGQANAWIREKERKRGLRIFKMTQPKYMRDIEECIKAGFPVLLENVEEVLDAVLDPLLLRQTFRSQGRVVIKLGDHEVEYNPTFRLYITTKLPNPHYMPELQIKVTIVNFTVTPKGLEEQLLADVVKYERADLEQKADKAITDIAENNERLAAKEKDILDQLRDSTGEILDNEALISSLQDAKKASEEIRVSLEEAEAAQKETVMARNRYRPVATRGSLIYNVIADIGAVDHMYQYSLDFFKKLFLQTLDRTEQSDNVDKRVATLLPAVTLDAYNTVCRGLFERDKQLFAFLMATSIHRDSGDIMFDEWQFFLRGCEGRRMLDYDERIPDWTNETAWNELAYLSTIQGLDDLRNDIVADEEDWSKWSTNPNAYKEYPAGAKNYSEWQRLLILRVFREDLVLYGMTSVVGHYLGKAFATSPSFDLEASFNDSSPTAPIVFVLTTGTDPTVTFNEFAERKGFTDKKLMLSLGQDQGVRAQEMISQGSRAGLWVYLQNCHVYASWMPSLERALEELLLGEKDGKVHKDFRLWLTTMPNPSFPVLVLQSGVKVTKEPPKGLKANVRDSFAQEVSSERWDSCPKNPGSWKRLLFNLTFFHAIVQERRKFGALGWNIAYEWNQSDFSASIKSLSTFLSDTEGVDDIPWSAVKYMIGVINYGGRVTDFLDGRCLQTILGNFFGAHVVEGQFNITADGVYCIPHNVENLSAVNTYLDELPPYEKPEMFGLHSNADITYNRNSSRKLIDTVLCVQPRTKTGGGMSTDDKVTNITLEFQQRLTPNIDKSQASEDTYRITESGAMISLGTVASQEIDFFNSLNERVKSSLAQLQRAIKGEVVMSALLESMYNAFILNKVPENWEKGGYLSRKPLASWFEDTLQRIDFLRDWNDNGQPSCFWLSGFFFPQGFLTGVLQTHSRLNKIPIDTIKFKTTVTNHDTAEQVVDPPETGVYVSGLFMEGARFNKGIMSIDESLPGELFTQMPVIWLEPVLAKDDSAIQVSIATPVEHYTCPVYKTSARAGALSTTGLSTNFVLNLDLNAGTANSAHWIKRGVALLCMLDD